MTDHDPRIVALAEDPRTAPVLLSIVESGGASVRAGCAAGLAAFERAVAERDLWLPLIGSALLAYVRSVADALVGPDIERDRPMVLAALRGDPCERWPAVCVCGLLDAAQDEGLLVGEDLELTPLGRAVLLVLEQQAEIARST